MPNFPTSLDAIANPTATTLRNDPGFELHAAISTLNDIAEALEAKIGIGASVPGSSAGVLRRTAAGASAWDVIQAGDLAPGAAGLTKIGEVAGTGSAAVLEIASIPGTYRALHVEATLRSNAGGASTFANLTFETSPTSNYHYQRLYGSAATVSAAEAFSQTQIFAGIVPASGAVATLFSTVSIDLPEYASTGMMKPVLQRAAAAYTIATTGFTADHTYGVFNQSAPITRVRITATAGNWIAGSRMTLWGLPA